MKTEELYFWEFLRLYRKQLKFPTKVLVNIFPQAGQTQTDRQSVGHAYGVNLMALITSNKISNHLVNLRFCTPTILCTLLMYYSIRIYMLFMKSKYNFKCNIEWHTVHYYTLLWYNGATGNLKLSTQITLPAFAAWFLPLPAVSQVEPTSAQFSPCRQCEKVGSHGQQFRGIQSTNLYLNDYSAHFTAPSFML